MARTPLVARGKNISLPSSYHTALAVIALEDGDITAADVIRKQINREMNARHGWEWELRIAEIAAKRGVAVP